MVSDTCKKCGGEWPAIPDLGRVDLRDAISQFRAGKPIDGIRLLREKAGAELVSAKAFYQHLVSAEGNCHRCDAPVDMNEWTLECPSCASLNYVPQFDGGVGGPRSEQGHPMKVYLDDERETPAGWERVYWPDEAITLLQTGEVTEISLDHDLGDDERGTGYDVILWIERAVATSEFVPPAIRVHSANSSARHKMELGVASIRRLAMARDEGVDV